MKATTSKNTATKTTSAPTFRSSGEESFFSNTNGNIKHFFNPTSIQRKCDHCHSEHHSNYNFIQKKCSECKKNEMIQRQTHQDIGFANSSENLSKMLSSKGTGTRLSKAVNADMSEAFGADFSKVRVHIGKDAVQMNQNLNARAFTHGSDIYFNKNQFNPESTEGKHLLAHELTHVVQQQSVPSAVTPTISRKESKPKRGTAAGAPKLVFIPSKFAPPCACLVVIHNDEQNAKLTAQLMHQHCHYNLILVNPQFGRMGREVYIPGGTGSKDPNELFPPEISDMCMRDEKACEDFLNNPRNKSSRKRKTILKYVQIQFFMTLKQCSNNFSLPVISLHNNDLKDTDNKDHSYLKKKTPKTTEELKKFGGIDKNTEDKGKARVDALKALLDKLFGRALRNKLNTPKKTNIFRWCISKDLTKCHIGNPDQPDQVVWVTKESDFKKLKAKDINVVLQTKDLKKGEGAGESDTDLSTLFITLRNIIRTIARDENTKTRADFRQDLLNLAGTLGRFSGPNFKTVEGVYTEVTRILTDTAQLIKAISRTFSKGIRSIVRQLYNSIHAEVRASQVQFVNIETPIDELKNQTDQGRIENYEMIVRTLDALGLHCCGTDTTDAENKIKEGLKKKNYAKK